MEYCTEFMKYETHCDIDVPIDGTYKVGQIMCDYDNLVKVLGQPLVADGYSTHVEWHLLISEGDNQVVATIYDWHSDYIPEKNKLWNVGGLDKNSFRYITSLLKEYLLEEDEE